MYEYSNISDDLLLFFYLKGHGKCFFSEYYYESQKDKLISSYDFTYIQNLLFDNENIITNIFYYYFPEEINNLKNKSISDISELIEQSTYSDIIKLKLYSFFINPDSIIRKLKHELLLVNNLLAKYYEKNYKAIINLQNSITYNELSDILKQIGNHSLDINDYKQIYVSPCLVNKNCINYYFHNDNLVLLLGYDYRDIVSLILLRKEPIVLNEVANVLSEKNRIDILDFILKKEEIAIRDLENELNISGTNAYYHITMMVKANMIITRNQGKQVLYSLNKNFFNSIIDHLKKYTKNERK